MQTNQNRTQTARADRSVPSFFRSLRFAAAGFRAFCRSEANARIHLAGTLLAAVLAILLKVNRAEAIALILVTGFVWSAELFNTAIEKTMDHLSPAQHPAVQFVKDVAAAAVLVAALTALLTGAFVFTPKILSL